MLTLKSLAFQGVLWIVFGYGLSQLLRLCSNLLLTRLLVPELFGLMALMHSFAIAVSMFSDIGIGTSIIQNNRSDDTDFLNTAWTMQFLRGLVLWIVCLSISWPVSLLYQDSRIIWILPITSLTILIGGLNSTSIFSLNKQLFVDRLVKLELFTQIISTAVMLLYAWFSPSIWALIFGNLVASTIHMIWSHRLTSSYHNSFHWDSDAAKEILSFGKWVFVSTALTFLSAQVDNLVLGKIFSLEFLGVYIIASVFANIPRQIIGQLSTKLIYPMIFLQIQLQRDVLRLKIMAKRRPILLFVAPFLAILIGFGDLIILTLYDARYSHGAWIMPILAMGLWPRVLSYTIDPVFLALGVPKYIAYGNLLVFIVVALGVPMMFNIYGITAVIVVIGFKELFSYIVVYYGLRKVELGVGRQDIIFTAVLVLWIVVIFCARELLGYGNFLDII
jgi:O-antigen/teichoic acid export membrane protein